ncbi:HTH-type transcriptional regulator/antitoxin HigA [Bacteroides zoogleoformans]|nr:ImmA/IrrE family metallo-endopeptidase [Bacteroides zoogleoformans]TWJ11099.1 HTH-type transcriptional regulator/antitoxin HigA [Bacteroides zoogleoformans]
MATRNESNTPWTVTHPGTILGYELEDRDISQKDFAVMIGMQKSHLNELIKGKRPMTKPMADKIEEVLGISAVSLVNMQTQYEHDMKVIERRGVEELEAQNALSLYNEIFDVKTLFKRIDKGLTTAVQQIKYIAENLCLPQPAELKLETSGMFRKSAKTGQDARMLMTWKLLAESKAKEQKVARPFNKDDKEAVVSALARALHDNRHTENTIKEILSARGIAFCIEKKVDKASVDGYSYIEDGTPYIILTKRYDRIDNFAFALMHEVGHLFLHYLDRSRRDCKLSIPDYDNESTEEKEANAFAANALIPDEEWKNAPRVRVNPVTIQHKYTQWAIKKGLNKWIVLGRISYETGMYKFHSDESRRIG